VVYGYFDMLMRYAMETEDWGAAAKMPRVPPSRDFVAMKLQLDTMTAVAHKDAASANAAAERLALLSMEHGQHPFVQQIITLQANAAQAFAAKLSGNIAEAVSRMKNAAAIEDSIDDLSQPPYPGIPAQH
jgi:hypothetical protein